MTAKLACFKAYDVRGRVPQDLNEDLAYAIGRAYAAEFAPEGAVMVGRDIRLTSTDLSAALTRGLNEAGVDTCDIGLCGTELVYFASARAGAGGGIMVTASHNPMEYNGMKFVRAGAIPVSNDSGLDRLEERVRTGNLGSLAAVPGTHRSENIDAEYTARILSFIDTGSLRPLRLVVNAGNGCAGPYFDRIAEPLPFETVRVHHEPDGTFPNGVPNPLLEENRPATADAVRAHRADMGVAWDGDFDRCFFFDENGEFVDGYYVVGLLASRLLKDRPGSAVIHDPRMIWNTVEMVREAGGVPVQWKTGHAFIKEKMRAEDAVYGGEMSAHHYFRDFAYCDSGMVPWLLMAALLSETGKPLSRLVAERRERYPSSGEINHRVTAPEKVIAAIRAHFEPQCTAVDEMDGIGVTFGDRWRFNIRCSQTEPILRLNVEARGDAGLMQARTDEILGLIQANS